MDPATAPARVPALPLVLVCAGCGALAVLVAALAVWACRRRSSATAARDVTASNCSADVGADVEQPSAPRKVVAVVGGGLSGLVCAKRFLEAGLDVIGFEQADQLGGLWVYREGPEGKTYASLRANVHKERLQLDGFPMPRTWPRYPSHWQLAEYLQAFAEHFGLPALYRMRTEVLSCRCTPEGSWMVTYRTIGAGGTAEEEKTVWVDAVCMCVGQACEPSAPTYPGQDTFRGRVLHSSQYRGQAAFLGQRVLVVGAGQASGTDVAQDLSFGAKQVFLSVRRGLILLPRFLGGRPNAEWFEKNVWSYVPLAWLLRLVVLSAHMMLYETRGTGSAEHHGIKGPSVLDTLRTGLDEARLSEWTATDACNLTQRVAVGAVRMRGAIQEFTPTGVRFVDGTEEQLDAVIWATGFKRDTTGLGCNVGMAEEASVKRIKLWRSVFHPSLPNFACCLQTHPYGSHWAVADMQARWIAGVFSGKLKLPPSKQMERESSAVAEHQSQDTCLDWREIAEVAKQMGHPRPGVLRLLALLATKPARTCRWLMQSNVSRRISVDECARPADDECKFQTKL